jgi:Flp pilus assembly pilin Flp
MKTLTIALIVAAVLALGSPNAHADWLSDFFNNIGSFVDGAVDNGVTIGLVLGS